MAVQDRIYRKISPHSYNDQGAKFTVIPDREADTNRKHILFLDVDDMRELRTVLDRYIGYAERNGG